MLSKESHRRPRFVIPDNGVFSQETQVGIFSPQKKKLMHRLCKVNCEAMAYFCLSHASNCLMVRRCHVI